MLHHVPNEQDTDYTGMEMKVCPEELKFEGEIRKIKQQQICKNRTRKRNM